MVSAGVTCFDEKSDKPIAEASVAENNDNLEASTEIFFEEKPKPKYKDGDREWINYEESDTKKAERGFKPFFYGKKFELSKESMEHAYDDEKDVGKEGEGNELYIKEKSENFFFMFNTIILP